jgi:hypothetical protein
LSSGTMMIGKKVVINPGTVFAYLNVETQKTKLL